MEIRFAWRRVRQAKLFTSCKPFQTENQRSVFRLSACQKLFFDTLKRPVGVEPCYTKTHVLEFLEECYVYQTA